MSSRFFKKALLVVIIVCMLASQTVFAAADTISQSGSSMDYIQSIMDMIKSDYNGEVSEQQLMFGILKGIYSTMDPYTYFMTPEEYASFNNQLSGITEGIGIQLEKKENYITVTAVFPGTPAEMAGILPQDRIISADGNNMVGVTIDDAAKVIRGTAGTKVKLEIQRNGQSKSIVKEIQRAKYTIESVTYEIKNNIGYIKLSAFDTNSSSHFNAALDEMDKQGITKIVLDLRNDGGGYVDQAVAIARRLIPKGLITKLDFKSDDITDLVYESYLDKPKYKLAVLVNGGSASASEILSGAIQDTAAGTLIGTKTFGKGVVQQVFPILTKEAYEKYYKSLGVSIVDSLKLFYKYNVIPLSSEIIGYAKITTGAYYTPKGRMIDKKGLTPDITVTDPVLVKGIDINSIQKLKMKEQPGLNGIGIDVYNAEKVLTLLGYKIDSPDSTLDKKTFDAIKLFQKSKGGKISGSLDISTQKWLNSELDKLQIKLDKQYAKALEVLGK